MALQRLKEAAEKAKIELSTTMQTEINLPFITADASGPKHLVKLTRAKLEEIVRDLIETLDQALRAGAEGRRLDASKIDEVVLVGGSTRMPMIQQMVKELFGRSRTRASTPTKSLPSAPPSRAACCRARSRTSCCSTSLRCRSAIETYGGVMTS